MWLWWQPFSYRWCPFSYSRRSIAQKSECITRWRRPLKSMDTWGSTTYWKLFWDHLTFIYVMQSNVITVCTRVLVAFFSQQYSLKTRGATYPLDILAIRMRLSANSVICVKNCPEVWSLRLWWQPFSYRWCPFSYSRRSIAQKSECITRWRRPLKSMEEWKYDKKWLEYSIYGLILLVICQHLWSILIGSTFLLSSL